MVSFLVAKCLMEGHFACDFARIPSAADEPEAIVLREGRFERTARLAGEERGTVDVCVLVVREAAPDAEGDAVAAERWLRERGWEAAAEAGSWRVVGMDTTAPAFREFDGSGRCVWAFDVTLTVVRSL